MSVRYIVSDIDLEKLMQDLIAAAEGLMWITVLIAPPFAFLIFFATRKLRPLFKLISTLLLILLLLSSMILVQLGFELTAGLANIYWLATSYFVYCLLAASTLQIKFKPARYLILSITVLPICFGYIFGTVGVLGLFVMAGDMVRPPEKTEQLSPGLICEVSLWGMAGSSSGYAIDLYEVWPKLSFIRRRVVRLSVVQAGYVGNQAPPDKTCADALNDYER